jgi:ankyrin repeat protein
VAADAQRDARPTWETDMRTFFFLAFSAMSIFLQTAGAAPPASANPEQIQAQLRSYFFDAARAGRQDKLGAFIDAHYDLDSRDEKGYTALILAAYHGQRGAVEQLLAAGADPCARDKRGNTALMGAIFRGELSIARILLAAGCDPDARNDAGQTPAMYAALFGRLELLDELAGRGADLQARDAAGNRVDTLLRGEIRQP